MKKFFLLTLLIGFALSSEAWAKEKSLFDNPDQDAQSAVQVEVEKDRSISQTENRKYIQPKEEYLSKKMQRLEDRIKEMEERISNLEKELKKNRKDEAKNEPVKPTVSERPAF